MFFFLADLAVFVIAVQTLEPGSTALFNSRRLCLQMISSVWKRMRLDGRQSDVRQHEASLHPFFPPFFLETTIWGWQRIEIRLILPQYKREKKKEIKRKFSRHRLSLVQCQAIPGPICTGSGASSEEVEDRATWKEARRRGDRACGNMKW